MNPYDPPQSPLHSSQKPLRPIKTNPLRVGLVAGLAFGLPLLILIAIFYLFVGS